VNYRDDHKPMELSNWKRGLKVIQRFLDEDRVPVLLCACADLGTCHRSIILDRLKRALDTVQILPLPSGRQKQRTLFD
jgi:hypothetical protein